MKKWIPGGLLLIVGSAHAFKQETPSMPLAEQLPIEVVLAQREMTVQLNGFANAMVVGGAMQSQGRGGCGGSGCLAAIVGAASAAKANERSMDLRDDLAGYDFNARIEQALRSKLPSGGLSPAPVFTVCDSASGYDLAAPLLGRAEYVSRGCGTTAQDGLLVLTPTYSFDAKFSNLIIAVTADYIDRKVLSRNRIKADLRFTYKYSYFISPDVIPGSDANMRALKWGALSKERLTNLLDEGADQIADMMVYDFSTEGRAERQTPKHGSTIFNGRPFNGQKVREGQDWVWTRMNDDSLRGYRPITFPIDGTPADNAAVTPRN